MYAYLLIPNGPGSFLVFYTFTSKIQVTEKVLWAKNISFNYISTVCSQFISHS